MTGQSPFRTEKPWQMWVAIALLAAFQCWVTLSHDAWLDEWQAVLLAVQSPDFHALSDNLRYEGHPPLWYLVLRVLSHAVTPEWTIRLSALAIALSTILIIQLRAPFALIDRVLLCLGYLLLIEYGSLSRGISLGVMMMFLFMATHSKWLRWAILILLPFVEVQFAVLSVFGAAMLWHEKQWDWRAAALWVLAMAAMVVLVMPASDVQTAVTLKPTYFARVALFLMMFGNLLLPLPMIDGEVTWFGNAPGLAGIVLSLLFVVMAVIQTRKDRLHLLTFLVFFGFTLLMATFVYQLSIRHAGLVAILLVVLTWRSAAAGNPIALPFRLWLGVSALCGIGLAVHIHQTGFDNSGKVAAYIRDHRLQDESWATFNDAHAVPVMGRLDRPVLNLTKQCRQTFIRWDRKITGRTAVQIETALRRTLKDYGPFYLISMARFENDDGARAITPLVTLMASFARGFTGGSSYLYKVGSGFPKTGRVPPLCKPLDSYPH